MNVNIDIEPAAEDILAEKLVLARFVDRPFEDFRAFGKFASYIYVRCPRVQGETRDRDPLQELMRIVVDDVAVLERARLRFVRVANQIDRFFFVGLDETPFHAAGKSGATAAAQTGGLHFVHDLGARHLHGFLQIFVAAGFEISVDVDLPIFAANIFENETMLERVRRLLIADC